MDDGSNEDISDNVQRQTRYTDFNPYSWGDGTDSVVTTRNDEQDEMHNSNQNAKHERRKLRKNNGRRRLNQNVHKQSKRDVKNAADVLDNIYYVQSANVISNLRQSNSFESINSDADKSLNIAVHDSELARMNAGESYNNNINGNLTEDIVSGQEHSDDDEVDMDDDRLQQSSNDTLHRVKRKSGKTTGALRPKGASDTGSKNTSRKKGEG